MASERIFSRFHLTLQRSIKRSGDCMPFTDPLEDDIKQTMSQYERDQVTSKNLRSLTSSEEVMSKVSTACKVAEDFIKSCWQTIQFLCRRNGIALEFFQIELIRSVLFSRIPKIYGHSCLTQKVEALEGLGVISPEEKNIFLQGQNIRVNAYVNSKIEEYSKRYVVVKAPRRSGKNFAGQIVMTALLVHEHAISIVTWAQDLRNGQSNKMAIENHLELLRTAMPSLTFSSTINSITVYPRPGYGSTLKIKPNTSSVSNTIVCVCFLIVILLLWFHYKCFLVSVVYLYFLFLFVLPLKSL